METQHQKWVNLSYLAVSALVAWVLFSFCQKVSSAYDLEATVKNLDLFLRVGSLVIMGALFFILYRNDQANQFMNEVVTELSRVTWPTQKETSSATFIVIVMVLISSFVLGLLDYLWTQVLKLVL